MVIMLSQTHASTDHTCGTGWQRSRLKGKRERCILPDYEQKILIQARKYAKLPKKWDKVSLPGQWLLVPASLVMVVVVV